MTDAPGWCGWRPVCDSSSSLRRQTMRRRSRMSKDDVLFGYRLRLFALAGEIGVRAACRAMGVHHSTYYRWAEKVERWGLEALRPRERRRPRMPNQLGPHLEQRIVAFALGQPGFGPKRISAELAREKWGGLEISPNGIWRVLKRHGLNTRRGRLAARDSDHRQRLRVSLARTRRPPRPARDPATTDPRRQTNLERSRRAAPAHDPRGMLATLLRALARPEADRAPTRPRRLPPLLQLRPRTHRPTHQRQSPRRDRLRCPKDANHEMSKRRYISGTGQSKGWGAFCR